MSIKSFKDLKIWKEAIEIAKYVYKIISLSSKFKYDFALKDQALRSSVSIASNIAEGFERNTNNEFKRYLLIAKGSAGELYTQLHLAREIGYITDIEFNQIGNRITILNQEIGSLIKYLRVHISQHSQHS